MKDLTAVQSPGKRAAAYWFVDGLPELGFGVIYLIWSGLGIIWESSPNNHWMKWGVVTAGIIFLVFFCWDRKILDLAAQRRPTQPAG